MAASVMGASVMGRRNTGRRNTGRRHRARVAGVPHGRYGAASNRRPFRVEKPEPDNLAPRNEFAYQGPRRKAHGGVAEWLKAHAWKVCIRETVSRVRIPLPPPFPSNDASPHTPHGIGSRKVSKALPV